VAETAWLHRLLEHRFAFVHTLLRLKQVDLVEDIDLRGCWGGRLGHRLLFWFFGVRLVSGREIFCLILLDGGLHLFDTRLKLHVLCFQMRHGFDQPQGVIEGHQFVSFCLLSECGENLELR